jgi:ribosomal protein S18 acetylase RimI-like enzyme
MTIKPAMEATPEVVDAVRRLLPQLSSATPPDPAGVARLLSAAGNTVLLARVEDTIVGMLTLVLYPLPSGLRARVEDVVVDDAARGRGVGAALTRAAIDRAERAGARTVDLTSRPSRQAANRLYEGLGFQQRESVVYRMTLAPARSE